MVPSRTKSRQNVEVCGDCGAFDATWASINKGILLCTQCCSVHRSLGRHISQVKHLLKSSWSPNQLSMVCTLNNNGANNIWEHLLLENGSKLLKKKPLAKDPISVKQEFIKAKHEQLAFALHNNQEYRSCSVENELGKQLHASVRAANLETSFRLLAGGADPNYFHDEKGSTPLHVATKSEQKLQVELLLVYGADPSCPDAHGKTPIDYAKQLVNKDLASRLIESQYEVTNTFYQYLTMKKPDFSNGVYFQIPEMGFKPNPTSLAKLQKLSNHVFEELVMDVFDEVERRETEAIWLACADTTDLHQVPFLPVDSTLSSPRNQGRQKLAKFSTPDFKALVYDILIDTQRRQQLADKAYMAQLRNLSTCVDDDPLYDSVASDDDYANVPNEDDDTDLGPNKSLNSSNTTIENTMKTNLVLEQLTKALKNSDNTITDLKNEVLNLRQCLKTLQKENFELKSQLSLQSHTSLRSNGDGSDILEEVKKSIANGQDEVDVRQKNKCLRPTSMYEPREGINKVQNWHALKNQLKQTDQSRNATQSLYSSHPDRETVLQCTEHITRSIQMLCKSIQDLEKEEYVTCAEKVKFSIVKLASSLPKESETDIVKKMIEFSTLLEPECTSLQKARMKGDSIAMEIHFGKVREIAFHLAKFTKEIVTKYSSNQ